MTMSIDSSGIDEVLASAVRRGDVPHIAAIAADGDGIFYEGGAGVRIAGESDDPVGTSTHFAIMSMTKMVTTTAALQQQERGELDFDAPIEEYRPEFAEIKVLEGFDGDEPILVEPASKATVHQLVTHTTGLGYWFWNDQLGKYEAATGVPNVVPGSIEAFKAPMTAHPGTSFVYGINTDWLGKVVEAVAGTTLDHVVRDNITGPLGMDDTMFRLDDARKANRVTVHVKGEDGAWASAERSSTRTLTGGPVATASTPPHATTSASSVHCCAAASWTASASWARTPSTRHSPPSSVTSVFPRRSSPWTRRSPTRCASDPAGPGATVC